MKIDEMDLKMVAEVLGRDCPFILFATVNEVFTDSSAEKSMSLELSVYIDRDTGRWRALEQVLKVTASMQLFAVEVLILNHSDAASRYRAVRGTVILQRQGASELFERFRWRARLDYGLQRAHQRRGGLIDIG